MTHDRDDTEVLHTHGKPPAVSTHEPLPCNRCRTLTARATLSAYGAMCFHCFDAYCGELQSSPRFTADKRTGGHRAWADALKAREEAGERLSIAQRDMWRAVRHVTTENQSEAP